MDPRTTVSVVDIKNRKYIGEIEAPGCALVFSFGPNSFSMVCADGSLLTIKFDAQARATASRTKPFFNPKKDPVFEHPAVAKTNGRLLFISYEGILHSVDLSSKEPGFEEPWSLLTDEDRHAGWRPGGWQLAAIHQKRNRLYVLMHQGGKWTAKQAGTEVWVYDIVQKKRVGRLHLDHPSKSVAVSQDERPQLYLLLSEKAALQIYDVDSLHAVGITEDLGDSPLVLHVQGD
jgi:methylamine dehydrogenase heavy chain